MKTCNIDKFFKQCESCKFYCYNSGCDGISCGDCENNGNKDTTHKGAACHCIDKAHRGDSCPYYKEEPHDERKKT